MQYLGVEHQVCAAASPAKKTHDTVDREEDEASQDLPHRLQDSLILTET